jgi:hypothetical protein
MLMRKTVLEKNPPVATSKRFHCEQQTITKTSAPASTLFFRPLWPRLPVAAEGRLQVTSPIQD